MKHLTITLLTLLVLGGCDNSQKASKPTEEPYLFSFEENTYIVEEYCLLHNAQKCPTEDCNKFVPELCKNQGMPHTEFARIRLFLTGALDKERIRSILARAEANEEYHNIHDCRYAESLKCKTNSCNSFVEGYCESFRYFKGEKLVAEKLLMEEEARKEKEKRDKAERILSNLESTEEEKAIAFCSVVPFSRIFFPEVSLDHKCEDWYLMTAIERSEKGLPKKEEFYWYWHPDNPKRIPVTYQKEELSLENI